MKIVTAGKRYADIDVYAGIIAYAELLRMRGHEAAAVTTAVQEGLGDLLRISFEGNVAVADRVWLRKEIIKRDRERGNE